MLLEMFNQGLLVPKTSQPFYFFSIFDNENGWNTSHSKALGQCGAIFYVAIPKLYSLGYRIRGLLDKSGLFPALDIPRIPEANHTQPLACFSIKISIVKLDFMHTHSDHLSSKSW